MVASRLLVTSASGRLGRRVVELLLTKGLDAIIATTRTPEKLADLSKSGRVEVRVGNFDDEKTLVGAFRDAGRALLISADGLDGTGGRAAQHARAIEALAEVGVHHVVYTSIPNPHGSPIASAPDHAAIEAALAASSLDFTILRNNVYTDTLLPLLRSAMATGIMIDSRNDGAIAYVTREDCARAAAAALSDTCWRGRLTFDLTGPEALTGDQLAGVASDVSRREVTRYGVPFETLVFSLMDDGMTEAEAKAMASFDLAARRGDLATTTDAVAVLGGRPPQSVHDFFVDHRAELNDVHPVV
jgi:NAD(P)H dehydrogenase (quinone)